ncbi:hypothetical protein THRCLA_08254 [Thraustotheca clavata]|uniref:Uncharacterized protein n=1 Tax=Thraustotheca clavata TaxID=74557 RepID=A0A1V9Z824_9STRA|nr:hypothetical protein THRCLA_08254 [Thraustotheca clavata]
MGKEEGKKSSSLWKWKKTARIHRKELCNAVGACNPRKILDQVVLQGGIHHTQMVVAVFNGRPLQRTCIDVLLTWYRAKRGEEYMLLHGVKEDWYQPTAEDIGASLLLRMKTFDAIGKEIIACAEFGPIVEDPAIRSQVENLLEAKTAFFTNIHIVPSNHHEISMEDTWSLLIDDKRIRISCESSLIPPFEALYTSHVLMTFAPHNPNSFLLAFGHDLDAPTQLHLKVDSNRTRDVIYLVFMAFKTQALASQAHSDAVLTGKSALHAVRTIVSPLQETSKFVLPWHQKPAVLKHRKSALVSSPGTSDDSDDSEGEFSSLLQDVDALLLGQSIIPEDPRIENDVDVAKLQNKVERLEQRLAQMHMDQLALEAQLEAHRSKETSNLST